MNIPDPHTPVSNANAPVNPTRRKLGLGLGAGVAITLASRPVLAGQCVSPSAHASATHLVSTHGTPAMCTGRTPAQWVASVSGNNPNNGFPGGNTEFNDTFLNGNGVNWPDGGSGRLHAVMAAVDNMNNNPTPNPISKEFAATLLNIRDGRIPSQVLDQADLVNMWIAFRDTGSFSPRAGVTWGSGLIIDYLRSLQGA